LEKNQEKSLDELKAEEAEKSSTAATITAPLEGELLAKSLVCNDCGKKFRTHAEAEFHATKT
jgi:hypothetical protein